MDYQSLGTVMMWISPDGEILTDSGSHIEYVISNPDKFGLRRKYIEQIYAKYNEPLKQEGKARKELIFELVRRGWIRLRRYPNQYWSINVFQLNDEVRARLCKWAINVLDGMSEFKELDREMPVRISCFENDDLLQMSIEKLTRKF
jgi:hypothetical protein